MSNDRTFARGKVFIFCVTHALRSDADLFGTRFDDVDLPDTVKKSFQIVDWQRVLSPISR